MPQGKYIADKECFCREVFKLVNEERRIVHSEALNELMDRGNDH